MIPHRASLTILQTTVLIDDNICLSSIDDSLFLLMACQRPYNLVDTTCKTPHMYAFATYGIPTISIGPVDCIQLALLF
jgi:hypothetical protein